jgi:hypothetical protein
VISGVDISLHTPSPLTSSSDSTNNQDTDIPHGFAFTLQDVGTRGLGDFTFKSTLGSNIMLGTPNANYSKNMCLINLKNLDLHLRYKVGLDNLSTALPNSYFIMINKRQFYINDHIQILWNVAYHIKATNFSDIDNINGTSYSIFYKILNFDNFSYIL